MIGKRAGARRSTAARSPDDAPPGSGEVRRFAATCGLVGLIAAIAALVVARPPAQAQALIMVSPVAANDPDFAGLPLLSSSGNLQQTLNTALGIVQRAEVAQLTAERLPASWSEDKVASSVKVTLPASSDLIEVTASAKSSATATDLANLYATAALQLRGSEVAPALADALRQAEVQVRALGPEVTPATLDAGRRLSTLAALQGHADPTLQLARAATPLPGRSLLTDAALLLLALVGGAVLGEVAGRLTQAVPGLELRPEAATPAGRALLAAEQRSEPAPVPDGRTVAPRRWVEGRRWFGVRSVTTATDMMRHDRAWDSRRRTTS